MTHWRALPEESVSCSKLQGGATAGGTDRSSGRPPVGPPEGKDYRHLFRRHSHTCVAPNSGTKINRTRPRIPTLTTQTPRRPIQNTALGNERRLSFKGPTPPDPRTSEGEWWEVRPEWSTVGASEVETPLAPGDPTPTALHHSRRKHSEVHF